MTVRRAIDRLALVVTGAATVLLLVWLLFHPLVVAGLQGGLVIWAAAARRVRSEYSGGRPQTTLG